MRGYEGAPDREPQDVKFQLLDKTTRIPVGFVIQLVVMTVMIALAFAATKADVAVTRADMMLALKELSKQEAVIQQQGQIIIDMRMSIQEIKVDQAYFHKQYEEDMIKYIRDPKAR